MARWLAVLFLGFVAGAATVLLVDPGQTETRVIAPVTDLDDAHAHAASASADGHGHGESSVTYDELPRATKSEVDRVIAEYGTKYATAADAMADGWFRGTRNLYGIGAHYIKNVTGFSVAVPFDLMNPPIVLFDGDGPDAKFAGVSYVVGGEAPEGFSGPYDSWHNHKSVCRQGGSINSLSEEGSPVWYSESECVAAGGVVMPITADMMIHMWIGPDYIDEAPIFAHDHPKLYDGYNPKRDGPPLASS
jgi:hypothetical protein